MKQIQVKDIMVPVSEYATVYEDATLYEALLVLEKSKILFQQNKDRHKAILIKSRADDSVVGKMGQLDVIRVLEPKYETIFQQTPLSKFGLGREFMEIMMDHYKLWDESLGTICRSMGRKKVSDLMYTPTEGECVNVNDNLSKGVHQLVMGHHQGLLVMDGTDIVGVLRLSDVFDEVCSIMKSELKTGSE